MFSYIKTSKIKELQGNPRTITNKSFDRLCKSIQENPEYFKARPLIISDRTGELVVIAGNQRLKAAKNLGIDEVPTFLISGLSEEKEKEIIIRDNVSNGRWDMDILANQWEIDDLIDWDVDIPKDWGNENLPDKEPERGIPVVKLEITFDDLDYFDDAKKRIKEIISLYPGTQIKER